MANDLKKLLSEARSAERLSAKEWIAALSDDFQELHGDRLFGDDAAIVGGVGRINGHAVTLIGIQKGKNLQENLEVNFGSPHPEGYRKAQRLMRQAEKFKRPVVTLIDTAGAYCGVDAEKRGQGSAIAESLLQMSDLSVPIVAIIIGEGGSGGALALGLANQVWMLENTFYAVLSPEGFASILWKDASRSIEAAELMKIDAASLKEMQICDRVFPESLNGEKLPQSKTVRMVKTALSEQLAKWQDLSAEAVTLERYQRFRKY